ncbi:amino acid adenylation domain-containing protein [Massilia sp. W12]|uniref:amino acid adenylation domain-containing protein n=1 Tax=Massilia sp. W12 TaxID=3126507 RepID=UPI0030D2133A
MHHSPAITPLLQWLREFGARSVNSMLIDERRCIPPHIALEFGNRGLFGLQIGQAYGGLGLSTCDALAVMRQLGALDLTLATLVSTHANGLYAVQHHGSERLKQQFLPQFAAGRQLCGFGLTETAAGANPWAIEMTAQALPFGGWRLHGRKIWVDSGAWASLLTVFAKTRAENGAISTSAFAVPLQGPGVHIESEAPTMGLRGMVQNDIRLHYAVLQQDALLGQVGDGMALAQEALNVGRLMLAAKSIGALGHCLQLMIRYASQRKIATGLLIENPVIRSWLGDFNARMQAVQALCWQLGAALDMGQAVPQEAFFALKNAAVDALWQCADASLQTLGGRGYMENNILPQILRDARTMRISEGPTETLNMALGATLVNQGEACLRFLSQDLQAPELARTLQDACQPLLDRVRQHSAFGAPQHALHWAYALLGQAATEAMLLAALRRAQPGALGAHAVLQARYAAALRDLSQSGVAESACLGAPDAAQLLAQLDAAIGAQQQSAPGMQYALDAMLQPQAGPACDFWRRQPAYQALHLQADFPRRKQAPALRKLALAWEFDWDAACARQLGPAHLQPDTLLAAAWMALLQRYCASQRITLGYAPASAPGQIPHVLPLAWHAPPQLGQALQELEAHLALLRQMRHSPSLPVHELLDKVSLLLCCDGALPLASLPALEIMLRPQSQVCEWHYDANLFSSGALTRMHAQWQTVLQAMLDSLAAPHTRLDALPCMPQAHSRYLSESLNHTELTLSGPGCIHELVQRQAQTNGAARALIAGAHLVSYAELEQAAHHLALALHANGVAAGDFVGLCLQHSPQMVIALLAIMKCGAAYIPLDPDYPQQRLQFVLEDSGMRFVLSSAALQAALPPHQARLLLLENLQAQAIDAAASLPAVNTHHTAYVLYTSGSTGQPKGVRVAHAAVVNFLHAMQANLQLGPQDVALAHTTLAFDIAGLEIYLPLAWGAAILLPPPEMRRDLHALGNYLQQHQVTLMQATPAFWQMLLLSGWAGMPQLTALSGGEALSLDLARTLLEKCGRLWNMYGPTEATIWCAMQELDAAMLAPQDAQIPIGKPVANARMYVLDAKQNLLPQGAPGELCIGGECLAQGYWQRAAVEQEKFFIWRDGQRLYRSGDLVRWREDGVLLFLGRLDRQIKLRGYRIEPGEIEHVLRRHALVQDAVVSSQQRGKHDALLIAYLQSAHHIPAEELRALLQDHVPPYMMPNHFICLPEFPLTANGKIDYLALPQAPSLEQAAPQETLTPLQHEMREIWAQALHLPAQHIGLESHFFSLGGHSLLAAQIVARINQTYQCALRLLDFFQHASIASLCACLEAALRQGPQAGVTASDKRLPAPLTNAQKNGFFKLRHMFAAHQNVFNTALTWLLQGALDLPRLEQALHTLQARHPMLSCRFIYDAAEPQNIDKISQLCQPPLPLPLQRHDLRAQIASGALAEAQWRAMLTEYELREFDLQRGPLIRAQILLLDETRAVLQIVLHHMVVDGPALALLVQELSSLYADPAAQLAPLQLDYCDYARWEAGHGGTQAAHDYWLRYLTPLPPKLQVRQLADAPGEACQEVVGAHLEKIDSATLAALMKVAQQHGCTLFMLLMSVYAALIARHADCEDVTIGYPQANRNQPGAEHVVGFFSAVAPLRLQCRRGVDGLELLPQVYRHLQDMLAHGNAALAPLLRQLGEPAHAGRHPFFQILFLLENPLAPSLAGLELRALPGSPPCPKFDLLLYAQLGPGTDGEQQLALYFQYSPQTFTRATVSMLGQEMRQTLLSLAQGGPS